MTTINVYIADTPEYWGEDATQTDATAAAAKLKEMLEEQLAEWYPGADVTITIGEPAANENYVQAFNQYGRDAVVEGEVDCYIAANWRTALDATA